MRRLGIALALVLTVGACSGSAEPATEEEPVEAAAPPQGYTTFEADGYTFAYPEDWEVVGLAGAGEGERDVSIRGPAEQAPLPPAISSVGTGQFPPQVSLSDYADAYNELQDLQLRDREVEREEPIDIAGAGEALVIESTYSTISDESGASIRELTVLALEAETNDKVALRMGAPTETFDQYAEVFETVIASIQVVGERTAT